MEYHMNDVRPDVMLVSWLEAVRLCSSLWLIRLSHVGRVSMACKLVNSF